MGFNCGIVGLPNVGKSTLFNALTATQSAEAANYPFCTIEPNVGRVGVADPRLTQLAALAKSQAIIPTQLEFVDIAGLVRGASKGEGLGNQFLGHIRSVDAIVHVLRCFEDDDITHVDASVDPVRDLSTIETELMLADIESLEKRVTSLAKQAKGGDKDAKEMSAIANEVLALLHKGEPASTYSVSPDQAHLFKQLHLLSAKPLLYVCNVGEEEAASGNTHSQAVQTYAASRSIPVVIISAAIEAEVATLPAEEQMEFLQTLGLQDTGLKRIVIEGYQLLDLLTFFTIGPKEARAWTTHRGAKAPQAAGCIHTDFERGFIRAETIGFDDYIACGGEAGAKAAGKMRLEGKEYVAQDGDVFHFRFNV